MTEKELRRLSRADLLQMLIEQSMELQKTQDRVHELEHKLSSRQIAIDNAGSIAEASLQLNSVFEAAQASCEQYVENIHDLSARQELLFRQREEESMREAEELIRTTERQCAQMLEQAEEDAQRIRDTALENVSRYYFPEPAANEETPRRRRRRSEKTQGNSRHW